MTTAWRGVVKDDDGEYWTEDGWSRMRHKAQVFHSREEAEVVGGRVVRLRTAKERRRDLYELEVAERKRRNDHDELVAKAERLSIVGWLNTWLRLNETILKNPERAGADYPERVAFHKGMVCVLRQAVARIPERDLRCDWETR